MVATPYFLLILHIIKHKHLMKKALLFFLLSIFALNINASIADSTKFEIHIVDYSNSWTSAMHYYFNDELKIEEVDNIDKKVIEVFTHRQLFGKESNSIRQYLEVFMLIDFQPEYVNRLPGERNQKRINIQYGDKSKSILVSNTYQRDIAGFISFLNILIPEQRRMKEFVDPSLPVKKK